jgi:hypothetical protein
MVVVLSGNASVLQFPVIDDRGVVIRRQGSRPQLDWTVSTPRIPARSTPSVSSSTSSPNLIWAQN